MFGREYYWRMTGVCEVVVGSRVELVLRGTKTGTGTNGELSFEGVEEVALVLLLEDASLEAEEIEFVEDEVVVVVAVTASEFGDPFLIPDDEEVGGLFVRRGGLSEDIWKRT